MSRQRHQQDDRANSDDELQAAISAERRELADVLAGLSADQWDAPTLCKGWRVRELVAHLVMPHRYSTRQVIGGMLAARGRFHVMADRFARRDAAELTPTELTRILRDNAEHQWKPPGGGYLGALSHDVIHGLDLTVGLGLDRVVPLNRVRTVLSGLTQKQLRYFGVDLTGVELRATDLDWSHGSGSPVSGRAQDLLLVVSGRKLPRGLTGEPAERFTAPVSPA